MNRKKFWSYYKKRISEFIKGEKIFLKIIDWNGRASELKGALRFHSTSFRSPSYNKGYTVRGSARPSPKFCSVSLRKTSYIPDVI